MTQDTGCFPLELVCALSVVQVVVAFFCRAVVVSVSVRVEI